MSKHTPLVSVITPFYNEEKFIEETILSVLDQTYQNWELILVDDGSSDSSSTVAKHYAATQSDKIRYFDHPDHSNLGSSESRNRGIENAKGKLIAFLDADDIFGSNYLENQVALFNSVDATMICEATVYWNSWRDKQKEDEVVPIGVPQNQVYQPQELNLLLYPLRKGAAAPCMCGIIVLKEALVKHGSFVESFRKNYTDQVFLSKLYYNEPVYISASCNNYYRQRDDSMMARIKDVSEYNKIRKQFLEWFKDYVENSDDINKEIYSLIKKTLLPYKYPRYYKAVHLFPGRVLSKVRKRLSVNSNHK